MIAALLCRCPLITFSQKKKLIKKKFGTEY
jgi:hypothetical protein